jgi:rhamnose utilization protein RhaD (predicted bifunctional aldolase and dehydrogenase)
MGIVLGGHGLINWADDDKECYEISLDLINRAASYLAETTLAKIHLAGQNITSLPAEQRKI